MWDQATATEKNAGTSPSPLEDFRAQSLGMLETCYCEIRTVSTTEYVWLQLGTLLTIFLPPSSLSDTQEGLIHQESYQY